MSSVSFVYSNRGSLTSSSFDARSSPSAIFHEYLLKFYVKDCTPGQIISTETFSDRPKAKVSLYLGGWDPLNEKSFGLQLFMDPKPPLSTPITMAIRHRFSFLKKNHEEGPTYDSIAVATFNNEKHEKPSKPSVVMAIDRKEFLSDYVSEDGTVSVRLRLLTESEPDTVPRQTNTFPETVNPALAASHSYFIETGLSKLLFVANERCFRESIGFQEKVETNSIVSFQLPTAILARLISLQCGIAIKVHPNVLITQGFLDREKKASDPVDSPVSLQELLNILSQSTLPLKSILLFLAVVYGASIKIGWATEGRWLVPDSKFVLSICHLIQLSTQTRWAIALEYLCNLLRYVLIHTKLTDLAHQMLQELVDKKFANPILANIIWAHLLYHGTTSFPKYSFQTIKSLTPSLCYPHAVVLPEQKALATRIESRGIRYISLASSTDPSKRVQILPELCIFWPWLQAELNQTCTEEFGIVLDLPLNTIVDIAKTLSCYSALELSSEFTQEEAVNMLLNGQRYHLFVNLDSYQPGSEPDKLLLQGDIVPNIVQRYINALFPKDMDTSTKLQLNNALKLGLNSRVSGLIQHIVENRKVEWHRCVTIEDISELPDHVRTEMLRALHRKCSN